MTDAPTYSHTALYPAVKVGSSASVKIRREIGVQGSQGLDRIPINGIPRESR